MTTAYWFMIASILLYNGIAFFMKKRITKAEIFTSSVFAIAYQQIFDIYLALKLDLYGYFDKGIEFGTLFIVFGLFPAITIIFLNWYSWDGKILHKIGYLGIWTVYSVFYQWLSVKSGMFYHNGWEYWYEWFIDPILFYILVLQLQITR